MKAVSVALFTTLITFAASAEAASRIVCRGGEFKVVVDVDVLESLPPQSQITVYRDDKKWDAFSAHTEYLELESFPVQYQWRFEDRDEGKLLIVSTKQPVGRSGRAGKGTYHYNRATSPIPLQPCSIQ